MRPIFSFLAILSFITVISITTSTPQSFAQVSVKRAADSVANSASSTTLPTPLTRKAIRDVLSGLSDAQARELLIKQLDKQVAEREKKLSKKESLSVVGTAAYLGQSLIKNWAENISSIPKIIPSLGTFIDHIAAKRAGRNIWFLPLTLLASLIGAWAIVHLFYRWTAKHRERLIDTRPSDLRGQIFIVTARFIYQFVQLMVFILSAYAIDAIINGDHTMDSAIVKYVIGATGWTLLAVISARYVFSPARPDLRLVSVDCKNAKFLTWRVGLIFGYSAFVFGWLFWAPNYGFPFGESRLGAWFSVAFYILVIQTFWQGREGFTQMLLGSEDEPSPTMRKFAESWPVIAMVLAFLQWLAINLIVATGNIASLTQAGMQFSLIILISAPLLGLAVSAVVRAIWPVNPDNEPPVQEAHKQTQAGLVRFGRIVVGAMVIVLFAGAWNIDLQDVASKGVGAQIAGAFVEIFMIFVIAYALWEVLNIIGDRQIALDKAEFGSGEEDGHGDGPGGMGGSRLGTLMPLIRGAGKVFIAVMAILAILGQMGVNVTPLLAGAGIIGMAVAFGAQTLVKDIFSGVFFLIDDAFRKGEYLDVGSVRGTVEKISVRSMQLRHHNGPLNTIPFGGIDQLTNYSRDWAIMKLSLRLTYDTDADKVRKMIKKLGQRLLDHPEFGPLFVEPLKSQGVRSMEDSAMIMRIKFTTKPGDQFTLRRFVLDEVRKLFDANGIKFANREVTVHLGGGNQEDKENLTTAQKVALAGAAAGVVQAADDASASGGKPAADTGL